MISLVMAVLHRLRSMWPGRLVAGPTDGNGLAIRYGARMASRCLMSGFDGEAWTHRTTLNHRFKCHSCRVRRGRWRAAHARRIIGIFAGPGIEDVLPGAARHLDRCWRRRAPCGIASEGAFAAGLAVVAGQQAPCPVRRALGGRPAAGPQILQEIDGPEAGD